MLPSIWAAKLDSKVSHSPLELAALGVLIVALVITFINWRCPQCNFYLMRRLYPSTCPRCDVTLHD